MCASYASHLLTFHQMAGGQRHWLLSVVRVYGRPPRPSTEARAARPPGTLWR
jgi:hypothetical protein